MTTVATIDVDRVMSPDDANALIGTTVPDVDAFRVTGPTRLVADGATVAMVFPTPGDRGTLRRAVLGLQWSETLRGKTGLRNASRVFGFAPRKPVLRREGCSATALAGEDPQTHAEIVAVAEGCGEALSRWLPDEAAELAATPVGSDWRLGSSGWTSGVINKTSALPYHRDRSNFDAWGAMPAVRRAVAGGHLHLPEYGVALPVKDGWTVAFNGWRVVHGVTPITVTEPDGYRITIVFYCLRGMKDCHTYAEETRHAARKRTERERRIAAGTTMGFAGFPPPTADRGRVS